MSQYKTILKHAFMAYLSIFSICLLNSCSDSTQEYVESGNLSPNTAPNITFTDPIIINIHEALSLTFSDYVNDDDEFSLTVSNPTIPGLTITNTGCNGTPSESGIYEIIIQATDSHGALSNGILILVVEAEMNDLPIPALPTTLGDYQGLIDNIPAHFTNNVAGFGNVSNSDNTPNDNQIDNATTTLGRVLFYDKRLSANNTISCATCHQQQHGFADPRALSLGFKGQETDRHAQALTNNRYYSRGHYFWDERADTLEEQVLIPIQSEVEMGMTLNELEEKLTLTTYYADLFEDAFGDETISSERIALALAQFVRSMISYNSKFDSIFDTTGTPNYALLSDSERRGLQLFSGNAGIPGRSVNCDACHESVSQISDTVHNIGLDPIDIDNGAGNGEFKAPSLRNVALRETFMHDGRFENLEQVIQHYNTGVENNPNLDNRLSRNGNPIRLNLSQQEIEDLIAYLESLSDTDSQSNPLHSDPFTIGTLDSLEVAN